jgi:nitric oxide reductase activation protein
MLTGAEREVIPMDFSPIGNDALKGGQRRQTTNYVHGGIHFNFPTFKHDHPPVVISQLDPELAKRLGIDIQEAGEQLIESDQDFRTGNA